MRFIVNSTDNQELVFLVCTAFAVKHSGDMAVIRRVVSADAVCPYGYWHDIFASWKQMQEVAWVVFNRLHYMEKKAEDCS